MRFKLFKTDLNSSLEDEVNSWLENQIGISINHVSGEENRIYIFYSTRKDKLNVLDEINDINNNIL